MAELPYVTLLLRVRGNTRTERWAMERRREFDQRVADLLKEAVAEGDLRSDVDVAARDPAAVRHDQLARGVVPARPAAAGRWRATRWPATVVRIAFSGLRA